MPAQSMPPQFVIEPIASSAFDGFVAYLNDHLSDNGKPGHVYFQPLPCAESAFLAERARAFREALDVPLGAPGWRRLWGAFTPDGRLAGHIDLRAHAERFAAHRCLLGMGVDRDFRQSGLGRRLIEHAEQWALIDGAMEWIDLQVLSVNEPAIRLYHRSGFVKTGEVLEMFKIDGQAFSFTNMSKRLQPKTAAMISR
jgi:ribosomal protein S18 acetylase RimI-like enzyme